MKRAYRRYVDSIILIGNYLLGYATDGSWITVMAMLALTSTAVQAMRDLAADLTDERTDA